MLKVELSSTRQQRSRGLKVSRGVKRGAAVDLLHLPSLEAEQLKERWRYRSFASAAPRAQLADLYDIEPK